MSQLWVLVKAVHKPLAAPGIAHAPRPHNLDAALCGADIRRGVQVTRADGEVIACRQCDALDRKAAQSASGGAGGGGETGAHA
jgi:hypothetical protein